MAQNHTLFSKGASVKKYTVQAPVPCAAFVQKLCQHYELSPFFARILAGRFSGAQSIDVFLNGTLKKDLPSPQILPDIDKATQRLAQAIKVGEKIALWGDYDVDGATSTALWTRYLNALGLKPRLYIPDRFKEGYGPNTEGMQKLHAEGIRLVLTIDCGTTAFQPLAYAHQNDMDVIVIDHHAPDTTLPHAAAVVNPKRTDLSKNENPLAILAAVGVSFFCLIALTQELRQQNFFQDDKQQPDLRLLLDLVAVGTLCDMVPMTGANRLLVRQGLRIIKKGFNPGLLSLWGTAPLDTITPHHIGFTLGPRLNAGGRLGNSTMASRLLSTPDPQTAQQLARQLITMNTTRQMIERNVTKEALTAAQKLSDQKILVAAGDDWHEGVIGIAAARLKDAFNKSAFVLTFDEHGHGKGSARGMPGDDLSFLIQKALAKGLIQKGGGHQAAGGISLSKDQLKGFSDFCQDPANIQPPRSSEKAPADLTVVTEGTLNFSSLTPDFWATLCTLGPFGPGHPEPVFLFKNVHLCNKRSFGQGHLELTLTQAAHKSVCALLFRSTGTPLGDFLTQDFVPAFHLIASVTYNDYKKTVQLLIKDIIPGAPQEKEACENAA